jgi:aminoglycoside phosphotransferase (APT) family kinase protein
MVDYAPLPTPDQLEILSKQLGGQVTHDHRIHGGLGGTMDVVRHENGDLLVLKRFWLPEDDELSPAESEFRALALAAEHGIPCPAPIWIDRIGLFPERAVVIEYMDGETLLQPSDPLDWAAQLAEALVRIHEIMPASEDREIFPVLALGEGPHEGQALPRDGSQHPLSERLRATRLEAMSTLQPETPVYTHHDYWPGNTLWNGERLVAVVDWEGAVIGDPAITVATCSFDIALLGLEDAAAHFVDVYRELSGRPLPNLAYWALFAVGRPLPDIAIWVPGLEAMGVNLSVAEARDRHTSLIEAALRPWSSVRK